MYVAGYLKNDGKNPGLADRTKVRSSVSQLSNLGSVVNNECRFITLTS